jgi:DNA-binding NarL/FixJ family response regulator
MSSIGVILCDDHAIFRQGMRVTLESSESLEILGEAENGEECLDLVSEVHPNVVFLDINMPVMDGIECLKRLKDEYPEVKVVALTQYDEKRFIKQMLKYGADGYILKTTSRKEMLKAIETVMSGGVYLAEEADKQMQGLKTAGEGSSLFPDLSDREKEVIRLMCEGLSTREIAERVHLSVHTIESHRSNVFKKVGVTNVAGLVRWAVNNGFDS